MSGPTLCMDDPAELFKNRVCLDELSKNVVGEFDAPRPPKVERCRPAGNTNPCQTLKIVHRLFLAQITPFRCDSALTQPLGGRLEATRLVSIFKQDGSNRGLHACNFIWLDAEFQIAGRMAGVTRIGTHRQPATLPRFKDCQEPCDAPFLQGRLYGTFTKATGALAVLRDARVIAVYRLGYRPTKEAGGSGVAGVIEGMVLRPC